MRQEKCLIEGLIERITYQNLETGFSILKCKIKKHTDVVPVIGCSNTVSVGEHFRAEGVWGYHKEYGKQFKAERILSFPPSTLEGIEKYLGSGLLKGIGPVYAKKLVTQFKETVFEVIENTPSKLEDIPGVGKKRAAMIQKGWQTQKFVREIMMFLHGHGVSTARAVRIYKTYKEDSIQILQENPYRLAKDIHGIGFLSADKIAQNIGIDKKAPTRLSAGLQFVLMGAQDQGHCGLPLTMLIEESQKILDVEDDRIKNVLHHDLESGELILDTVENEPIVFLPPLYHMEKNIAERIKTLLTGAFPAKIDGPAALKWVQDQQKITLSSSQEQAVLKALKSKVSIITGGPGVGKTTLVNCLLHILSKKIEAIKLAAPTGRAAKRLSESTGQRATTIHRLLEPNLQKGGFSRNEQNRLSCQALILDEVSMIDVPLMHAILKAVPEECVLMLVGDVDQLPSVGPGKVLEDLITSGIIPTVRLTEIFRQGKESMIITNAHRVNKGIMPIIENKLEGDFFFINIKDPEEGVDKIVKIVGQRLPETFGVNPIGDVQVLTPMNRGVLGARNLNMSLQKILNDKNINGLNVFGQAFNIGDKVIHLTNDYEKDVYNGDIGFIEGLDFDSQEAMITFNGERVCFQFGEMDNLTLAYAITIHKAQGSEFPYVVMPLAMIHYPMLMKNLVYTAITRARKKVIVVGEKKALWLALNKKGNQRRWTNLQKWL